MRTIKVLNLKCNGCANTIIKGLLSIEGIENVSIDVATSKVSFVSTEEEALKSVKEKLSAMGYPEVGDDNTIIHKAKSFVSCATGRMIAE
ncbi:heavy metal-associated domain-containing protein [Lutibacter sp.]|uniref:heavy-metal-associated domain-containing protein n=1 Tax=Lutibacter sp. TaxID=1925666 RepID=UPI0025C32618|nr:heavy metal-associated domain-containing protein [Lutibacter sp.]MCF6182879.1 heavy-metal-associated domain-containing protein [Lutibacter sp.]